MAEGVKVAVVLPSVREEPLQVRTLPSLDRTYIPDGVTLDVRVMRNVFNAVYAWNEGYLQDPNADIFFMAADDLVFRDPSWLVELINCMYVDLKGYGVVAFRDGYSDAPSHFGISKKFIDYELGGYFIPPCYKAQFLDVEIVQRAIRANCFIHSDVVIEHIHPLITEEGVMDTHYERSFKMAEEDKRVYNSRFADGFPNTWSNPYFKNPREVPGRAIGVRLGKPKPQWIQNLVSARLENPVFMVSGKPSHMAANDIVKDFLKYSNLSHILFIDDDMTFTRADVDNLAEGHLVMGFATHKTMPPHALVLKKVDSNLGLPPHVRHYHYGALRDVPDNETIAVDAVGLGFTLISRELLVRMISEYGVEYTDWFLFGPGGIGEDVMFSDRAIELGYQPLVDTSVKIGHIGEFPIGWSQHKEYISLGEFNG